MNMKTITLNGNAYTAREFDFNLICELEDMGLTMETMESKGMTFIRAYLALCMGTNRAVAGQEINAHIVNGGKLDDILTTAGEMMEESDFFRSLNEDEEENAPEDAKEETAKETKTK